MEIDVIKIRKKIELSLQQTGDYSEKQCHDIAFHLTDWFDNLIELLEFFQYPDKYESVEVNKILLDFLIHVPNHIATAAKLMTDLDIEDLDK